MESYNRESIEIKKLQNRVQVLRVFMRKYRKEFTVRSLHCQQLSVVCKHSLPNIGRVRPLRNSTLPVSTRLKEITKEVTRFT